MSSFSSRPGLVRSLAFLGLLLAAAPPLVRACACGCGIYEVGTASMFPQKAGQTVFLENDYQDQNRNWRGDTRAPAADNPDRDIRTDFVTVGMQALFNRSWGLQLDLPYEQRHFATTGGATGHDPV